MTLQAQDIAQYLADHPDFFDQHPELLVEHAVAPPAKRPGDFARRAAVADAARADQGARDAHRGDGAPRPGERRDRRQAGQLDARAAARNRRRRAAGHADRRAEARLRRSACRAAAVERDAPVVADQECAQPVESDTISLANSMRVPFCGSNVGFEAASWIDDDGASVQSLAMIPLRVGADPQTFGLLVLGFGRQGPLPDHDGHRLPRADRRTRERGARPSARLTHDAGGLRGRRLPCGAFEASAGCRRTRRRPTRATWRASPNSPARRPSRI